MTIHYNLDKFNLILNIAHVWEPSDSPWEPSDSPLPCVP